MDNWPNFFIVGAGKSGTTSLYSYLKEIHDIYMSPIKEPHYFSFNTVPKNEPKMKPIQNKEKYLELFKSVQEEKIIGEASTSYLSDPQTPYLIYEKIPNAHILISLRNPIEKAFSGFLMWKRNNEIDLDFHDFLPKYLKDRNRKTGIESCLYHDDVKKYVEIFGKDKVKIIIFEEWIKDPKSILKEILKFLELESNLFPFENIIYNEFYEYRVQRAEKILNNSIITKTARLFLSKTSRKYLVRKFLSKEKPSINDSDRKKLKEFFHEDVRKLQKLLDRALPWTEFKEK